MMEDILKNKLFHQIKGLSLLKLKKDPIIQNQISKTFDKNNKEAFSNEVSSR